ncbi:glycosyltransferase family 4 protein [uncultured Draconibacterium sp.]|uniref:glycosyltransferase family 4 protein n=1 Tax=uncultured Draconibacterium sp. TaxID=1573823 RepID=UPI0025FD4722|nr:glycosyltransferase family 4 protein [uncultured Draconibacterium sp.]
MNKKVLIITYYWPPAGGPGVQRVLKFAKYLPEFGWEPIILTIDNGDFHAIDASLQKDIPKGIKIYKAGSFSALDLYKKLKGGKREISSFELTKKDGGLGFKLTKWIRANFFIPDARKGWNRAAVKQGLKIIKEEKPDLIFTSSPPHSLQLIGHKLKKKTGIKWVADFRDPWTDAFWDKELPRLEVLQKYNLKLEKKILSSADELITVGKGCASLLDKQKTKSFHLIFNGFDESDFFPKNTAASKKFRITYVGSISNSQNPENFFKAVEQLPNKYKQLLDINFYGKFDDEVKKSSDSHGANTNFYNYIPHSEAINKIINSELLLLLIPRKSEGIITGKLFEYLATNNFILALAPTNNDINSILEKCNAGLTFNYEANLLEILIERIKLWKRHGGHDPSTDEILQYSRKHITKELATIFNTSV